MVIYGFPYKSLHPFQPESTFTMWYEDSWEIYIDERCVASGRYYHSEDLMAYEAARRLLFDKPPAPEEKTINFFKGIGLFINSLTVKVNTLLKALGPRPVEKLRELRIMGKRPSSCECPIARYLSLNGIKNPRVHTTAVYLTPSELKGDVVKVDTNDAIFQFINNFDQGRYPELEETRR